MSPQQDRPTSAEKLRTALPEIAGKTVRRTVVFWRGDQWQAFLIFTDGTSYELYGRGEMNGARSVGRGVSDDRIGEWIAHQGADWSVAAPEP